MADNKKKKGAADRSKIAGRERYEVDYEAKKMKTTTDAIQKAIKKAHSNLRKDVEAVLKAHTSRGKKKR